jgi:CelD/BcsL family acetyltransferase involved in cellulose biosynthesis
VTFDASQVEQSVEDFDKAKGIVEAAIRTIGIDPAAATARSGPKHASWTFQRGSAAILVNLTQRKEDDKLYVRVVSPVMTLPDEATRGALYVRLLELNGKGLANCGFGLIGDRVVVVSERPAGGMDEAECEQIIRHLAAVADTYDDRLVQEFGGKRASDVKGEG